MARPRTECLGIMDVGYRRAAPVTALEEGGGLATEINGWPVLLCRSGGDHHAVVNRCTHADSALVGGRVRRGSIICPAHGAIFNLQTGACVGGAGYGPLKVFPARVVDGWVEVRVPEEAPPPRHRPVAP